jgi:ATP-binding cassette, subfamily F, member 3
LKLFEKLKFQIERGGRWAILGSNGTGKTTLLQCLLGKLQPDTGSVTIGSGVKIGYFDQLLRDLDLSKSPMEAIRIPGVDHNDLQRRNYLAAFGITGTMAQQPLASLSGGERNRTMLAWLSAQNVNFLVMDEPTNHLDLWSREALQHAIAAYDGTVLLVTHDRYLVNAIAQNLIVISNGQAKVIHGNYETYRHLHKEGLTIADRREHISQGGMTETMAREETIAKPNLKAVKPKRRFPYRKAEAIEADIQQTETAIARLHEQMLLPDVLRDGRRVKELQSNIESKNVELSKLYAHFEEAMELN